MGAAVGIGLLASLSIFESIGLPRAEPIDTTAWLAATAGDTLTVGFSAYGNRSSVVILRVFGGRQGLSLRR